MIATMFGRTPTCSYSRDVGKAMCIVNLNAQEKKMHIKNVASKQVSLMMYCPLGFYSTESAHEKERLRD